MPVWPSAARPSRRWARSLLVLGAGVVAAVALATPQHGGPVPRPAPPTPAAAVRCLAAEPSMRYVVLFAPGTPPDAARAEIVGACGTTTIYYRQIAVAVATSADPGFASRIGVHRAYSAEREALGTRRGFPAPPPGPDLPTPAPAPPPAVPPPAAPPPAVPPPADRSGEQWDMAMIHADGAHAVERGSPAVEVGVLDSGIDPDHPDLAAALDPTRSAGCLTGAPDTREEAWRPTGVAHGTHVAGTIAAADDGRGITGVAPGVRIASVKVVDDDGFIYPEYAVCGFVWAAEQHFRVTNNSYFVDPWLYTCRTVAGQGVAYEAVRRAVAYATAQGVLSVAAAGNEGEDVAHPVLDTHSPDNTPQPTTRPVDPSCELLPGELPDVVLVSAVGGQRTKADYSNYGLGAVDVTAPGGDPEQPVAGGSERCVLSTLPLPAAYGYLCGTSMATPHATGVAALLASTHPLASPRALATLLAEQAEPIPCQPTDVGCLALPEGSSYYGHGLVDAVRAAAGG